VSDHSPSLRTYVLDTSVLLAAPDAMTKFEEHQVIIPIVVLDELESKRNDPRLGWAARTALRHLESLRVTHGTVTVPVPVNDRGGTLQVELNHRNADVLPEPLRGNSADDRILTVAANLAADDRRVTVVSKDTPLRLRATICGLAADEYRHEQASLDGYTGIVRITVDDGLIDKLHDAASSGMLATDLGLDDVPVNAGVIATGHCGASALGRVHADGRVRIIADRQVGTARPNSAEQKVALELLDDPDVQVVGLRGAAGTGKTYLALAAALASLDRGDHDRIIVLRSLHEVGGEKLGTLPGDENEKLAPAARAITDALDALVGPARAKRLIEDRTIEVLPITGLRGRTVTGTYLIADDSQNFERNTVRAILSRAGGPSVRQDRRGTSQPQPTKVVLTFDTSQIDHPFIGKRDGVAAVAAKLVEANTPLFGYVEHTKVERSAVAALAAEALCDSEAC